MLDDFSDKGIAYSFGIGTNIVWDKDMADRGFQVYCYDHTIAGLPVVCDGLNFFRTGIAGENDEKNHLLSMETILKNNGHENDKNLIFKMDVEGAEWDFLENTSSQLLSKFAQMTFELHDMTNSKNEDRVISILKKIRETHVPVWIHANNAEGVECANGVKIPKLLEITFVLKEKYEWLDDVYNCPTELDSPNVREYFDIELLDWGTLNNQD